MSTFGPLIFDARHGIFRPSRSLFPHFRRFPAFIPVSFGALCVCRSEKSLGRNAGFPGFSAEIDLEGQESPWRAIKISGPALLLNGHLRGSLPSVRLVAQGGKLGMMSIFLKSGFLVLELCCARSAFCEVGSFEVRRAPPAPSRERKAQERAKRKRGPCAAGGGERESRAGSRFACLLIDRSFQVF